MDSITHIALGACIGEAALSKEFGKKAMVLGAVAQSLPDIDVLASLWLPPADNLLFHRGFTHSFLFGAIAAALLSYMVQKKASAHISFFKLFLFFCFQIWLHELLDTCNAYGTGLFEPFSHHRFSFHLLFVADPFFTSSLVVATVVLIILPRENTRRRRWPLIGLTPATIYFCYAVFNKQVVKEEVTKSLSLQHILSNDVIITPTPFNSWLWYIVAATDSGYVVGYRSVFGKNGRPTSFTYYPKQEQLLKDVNKTEDVKQLQRFADNYYTVEQKDSLLILNVLRFGQVAGWQNAKAEFAFQYFLNPGYDNSLVVQRGRFKGWNRETFIKMYNRIKGN